MRLILYFTMFTILCWPALSRDGSTDRDILALIYEAEVYGERDTAIQAFRDRLLKAQHPDEIDTLVRAMAVVKQPLMQHQFPALMASLLDNVEPPNAVIEIGAMGYLLATDFWVELGDWAGDVFVRRIEPGRIVLESVNGARTEHRLTTLPIEVADQPRGRCVLAEADAGTVLRFIAGRAGLNVFIPSSMDRRLSGIYTFPDWLTLMDGLCRDGGIMWTRRRENVIFRINPAATGMEILPGIDRRGENLANFLDQLANAFDMELVIDEELADINVDIVLEDQPWDEVLDCLSIMNGFTWNQVRDPSGRARLVIQKE